MKKKAVIIGAGITGLCAGSYLQMNGYETHIFESHTLPGGLCTSWERGGYNIDGCIHWFVGSSPSDNFYNLWNELIDMKKMKFFDHEIFCRVEDSEGNHINIFSDVDQLEKELLDKAPEDSNLIYDLTASIRKFSQFKFPNEKPLELCNFNERVSVGLRVLPFLKDINKWVKLSADEYATRFTNPLLRLAIESIYISETAFLFQLNTLAWYNKKSAGYPIGGSLNFSKILEKKFIELGGKINYRSKVAKITTEIADGRNKVCGIELENGTQEAADYIVSAADGHSTIFKLLDSKFINEETIFPYEKLDTCPSLIYISFGIKQKFEDIPGQVVLSLDKELEIDAGTKIKSITFRIFNYDSTLAPEGSTLISCLIPTNQHQYWIDLKKNEPEKYKGEKDRIGKDVLACFENRFNGASEQLEMMDIATPASITRYTHNWKGSFAGWSMNAKTVMRKIRKTLPDLDNLYLAGQWVEVVGGLPVAIMSGRQAAQLICDKDGKEFETTHY